MGEPHAAAIPFVPVKPSYRGRRKAPKSSTPSALRFLESYLDGKRNRKVAAAALLGCSTRTAGRITSKVTPYTGAMKLEWVSRICVATGKPLDAVLGMKQEKSFRVALVGWNHSEDGSIALQDAMDCGLAIVNRALVGFGLSGLTTMKHHDGHPERVHVMLSPALDMAVHGKEYEPHQLIVTSEPHSSGEDRMRLQYICPLRGLFAEGRLTVGFLEAQLKEIYVRTKNIAAELQRESLRRT